MPEPAPPQRSNGGKVSVASARAGVAIAAAVTLAAPVAMRFEGYISRAQNDPVGIQTYCYGETQGVDPSRIYSQSECATLLRARMQRDYAPKLLKCIPQLATKPNELAALLDLSYNTGVGAVCKSNLAVNARSGAVERVCDALPSFYVTARDRRSGKRIALPGLVKRRQAEAALCRKDIH